MDTSLVDLRDYRDDFYACLYRRADALFEVADALLTAGTLPSPVHLSGEPTHRRGWGSQPASSPASSASALPLRRARARPANAGCGATVVDGRSIADRAIARATRMIVKPTYVMADNGNGYVK
jgi:hypothetical protein